MVDRQLVRAQDLVVVEIRDRNLRRRDQEEVLLRDVEHVLFKFRKLSGSRHRHSVHHERRKDLCVSVLLRMQVEHEVDDRSLQACSQSLVDRESGAGDLGGSLEIEDVQILSDIPVGLLFKIKYTRFAPFPEFHVVAVVEAFLHVLVRGVRHFQQRFLQPCLRLADLSVQFLDLVAELFHFGHERRSILTVLLQNRDLLRLGLLLVLHLFNGREDLSSLQIVLTHLVDSEIALSPGLDSLFYSVKILSDSLNVQHLYTSGFCIIKTDFFCTSHKVPASLRPFPAFRSAGRMLSRNRLRPAHR